MGSKPRSLIGKQRAAGSRAMSPGAEAPVVAFWLGPPAPPAIKHLTRALQGAVLLAMASWIFLLGGLRLSPRPTADGESNDTSQLFNWHPLLLTLGFPVLMAEAVLAYRAPLVPLKDRCAAAPGIRLNELPSAPAHQLPVPACCVQGAQQGIPLFAAHGGAHLHGAGRGRGIQVAHAQAPCPCAQPVSWSAAAAMPSLWCFPQPLPFLLNGRRAAAGTAPTAGWAWRFCRCSHSST